VLREYEFTLITKAEIPDADRAKVFEKYENLLYQDSGELLKRDDWGVKKLSFPINKKFRGHYMHYDFVNTKPENLKEAERLLRIDEHVMRYLLVRTNDKCDVAKRREELVKQVSQRQMQDN
jgi:small subunit ribosomal protein S6